MKLITSPSKTRSKLFRLPLIDTLLLVAIIAVNVYTICLPILPTALFWWQKHFSGRMVELQQSINLPPADSRPAANRLIIPAMLFDGQVFDGPDMRTLRQGVWRLPHTSSPDRGGNTVIVGHRFTYTNPRGDFYQLNNVKIGDPIALFWQKKEYLYKVSDVRVVPPTATDVEANTPNPELTLYTCTPLWWPHNRLVVTAKLESIK